MLQVPHAIGCCIDVVLMEVFTCCWEDGAEGVGETGWGLCDVYSTSWQNRNLNSGGKQEIFSIMIEEASN